MAGITGRCIKLLKLLLAEQGPLTVRQLAEKMRISERTVRYDGVVLSNWLEENGVKLEKRPKVGYYLPDKEAARRLMDVGYYEEADSAFYYTAEERVFKIIGLILSGEEPILIQDIMDHLYVSKSTVAKDLATVRDWFAARGVGLREKPNQGMRLHVDEQKWRALVMDWVRENVAEEELSRSLLEMILTGKYDRGRSHETLKYLDKILTISNFQSIRDAIRDVCDRLDMQLSDTAFVNLLLHIAIALNRLVREKQIVMPEERLHDLKQRPEFAAVEDVFLPLMAQQGVEAPESEVGYITLHLLSAQRLRGERRGHDERVEDMIEVVLLHVYKRYRVDLSHNEILRQGLALHLQPAIFRDEYAVVTENPLLESVKRDYPETYRLCQEAIEEINQRFDLSFDENEISFIAIHVEAALKYYRGMRSQFAPVNVALVCASGLGTAKILAANIRSEFPDLRIANEYSMLDLMDQDLSDIQLVIATVPIPFPLSRPVIQVGAVPEREDILRIRNFLQSRGSSALPDIDGLVKIIENHCAVENGVQLRRELEGYLGRAYGQPRESSALVALLEGHVLLQQRAEDWEDATRRACAPMLDSRTIKAGYVDALVQAKDRFGQYSFIGPGLCMPHAVDFENVNRLGMALFGVQEPVMVDGGDGKAQPVWLFMPLAMPDIEAHLPLLYDINALVSFEPHFARKMAACRTEGEALSLIAVLMEGLAEP